MRRISVLALLLCGLLGAGVAQAQRDGGARDGGVDAAADELRRAVDTDPFAGEGALASEASGDPVGVDREEAHALSSLPPDDEIELARQVPVRHGAVLDAIAGVHESSHRVELELAHGLAIVDETLRFGSTARHPAELRYRIGVPADAAIVSLSVCGAAGCRDGVAAEPLILDAYDRQVRMRAEQQAALPIAHARIEAGDRGERSLVIEAAPVPAAIERVGDAVRRIEPWLEVRVRWVAEARLSGGAVRLVLPARGRDARAAPAIVTVRALDVVAPSLDGAPLEGESEAVDPSRAIVIEALAPQTLPDRAEALVVPCDAGRCARLTAVGARPRLAARDVVVLIDASPSTTDGARGRIADTARTLLALLPPGSRARVIAFAARAEPLTEGWAAPTEVSADVLREAVDRELGSATRFESAWAMISGDASPGMLVVIVGDGGLTTGAAGSAALAAARTAGVQLASVNVADRSSTEALRDAVASTSGVAIDAGEEAQLASSRHGDGPLARRLTTLLARTVAEQVVARVDGRSEELGALREGESLVWEGPIERRAQLTLGSGAASASAPDTALAAVLTARLSRWGAMVAIDPGDAAPHAACAAGETHPARPAASREGVSTVRAPVALARVRACAPTVRMEEVDGTVHRGMPARALLAMLRRRVIPLARGCFRDDRHGRADYAVRAVYDILLADREVIGIAIDGAIEPELAACLSTAVDRLDVPRFDGVVRVRWPLRTEARVPPPRLELASDVEHLVDGLIEPGDELPPTP